MYSDTTYKHELYATAKGSAWQCDLTDKIFLDFKGGVLAFKIQDFFSFCRKVKNVDIHEMIFNVSDSYDFEVIDSPQNQISLKLTLCDIIQLRELIDGTKFAIEMYSMLHEVLGEYEVV